ncbi:response regulator [Paenibacillus filicis]|uniref:histidine kinase n=1 Tax=Paenibacillus filicis TaxID=669464 RepID=A0ABU9DQD7_9BACL
MKMKSKLMLGFGIVLVILFTLAGISINRLSSTDSSIREIYENRYAKVKLSTQMRKDTYELSQALGNLLLVDEETSNRFTMERMRVLGSTMKKKLKEIDALPLDAAERSLVDNLQARSDAYLVYIDQLIRLYQEGKKEQALELRNGNGSKLRDELTQAMGDMNQLEEQYMDNEVTTALADNKKTYTLTGILTLLGLIIGAGILYWNLHSVSKGISILSAMISNFSGGKRGDRSYRVQVESSDEFGQVALMFNRLADDLEEAATKERELARINGEMLWLRTEAGLLYSELQESDKVEKLAEGFIKRIARVLDAYSGAFYIVQTGLMKDNKLELAGAYATGKDEALRELSVGEGLIGQAAKDGQAVRITGHAGEYGSIRSSYGGMEPMNVTIQPVKYEDEVIAVFELVGFREHTEIELKLLEETADRVGVLLNMLQGRLKIEELLRIHQALTDELQTQSEELLSQQDELKASNERLEEQTKALQASEELLQRQQEELEQSNEALVRKSAELEEQVTATEEVNRQVELANHSLEEQALELALASRYKTEFLANMSHELRTPLNSLLILSQLLKENKERNLSDKQVEYAETIYSSGCDLLKLIDDVLDLAKVESGRMDVHTESILIRDIVESIDKAFKPLARTKGLEFEIHVKKDVPERIDTDYGRLQQILKNLLSNALKFTQKGGVTVTIHRQTEQASGRGPMLAFEVEDTGIGISKDKQDLIFEAFQQADGTTSRKYGGTGLGLSISRQLAGLLSGGIELVSEEGKGSCFTLYLPVEPAQATAVAEAAPASDMRILPPGYSASSQKEDAGQLLYPGAHKLLDSPLLGSLTDDRDRIETGDRVLLIIEDDVQFATILLDMARSRGFKTIVALQGDTGLNLARKYKPDAILLDIQLPVIDGWSVLVQLKGDSATRHIPVHVISVVDEIQQGLAMGAIAWLRKPSGREQLEAAFAHIQSFLNRDLRKLLILQSEEMKSNGVIELISHDDVSITATSEESEALRELKSQPYDCMVIDYGHTDLALYELLDRIKADEALRRIPIILYTGKTLDKRDQMRLKKYAESIIIKDVKSPERLLDETSLFLHRIETRLPEEKQRVLQKLHNIEALFSGKKVLLVDDDIRNVFALSNLLEGLDMEVAFAETGKQALAQLEREPDFDLVLMDIMMPEMDGYEAMRTIRADERFDRLPIIALTAKAMKDDREKCIQAGASDYITKPIHTEQLLSLMRVWLCK